MARRPLGLPEPVRGLKIQGPADANPGNSTIVAADTTWNVGYSPTGRIVSFAAAAGEGDSASFSYDANGNRMASTRVLAGQRPAVATPCRSPKLGAPSGDERSRSKSVLALLVAKLQSLHFPWREIPR